MNLFDKIKNFFLNRKAKRLEERIQTDDGYVTKVMSIDNVALADLFEKSLPPKMLTLINQIRRSIYNDPLSTKVSDEKLIEITRAFFATIDDEFSERVNGILDKKDARFVLRIDPSFKGENRVSSAKYPIEISVTKYGDLRDVYELVHELTHCLDIDRGETDTKRILGEVAPQCMERLLDGYLIENCDALGFNIDDLREDIEIRKITTFISRIKNAIEFNKKQRERIYGEIDSRYMLAQLYQTELMKNERKDAIEKIAKFIRCVRDDDFDGANEAIGVDLRKENKLQRSSLISETISKAEETIYRFKLTSDYEDLLIRINESLSQNQDYKFSYSIQDIQFDIIVMAPKDGIDIPSIVFIPKSGNISNTITLEANNIESEDMADQLERAGDTGIHLIKMLKENPSPIIIPMLPSVDGGIPYYQQLSRECFELQESDKYYRIDEQLVKIIESVREILKTEYSIDCDDKIFLNGYSSSGVFAQRFCLIHPELVKAACIGGASRQYTCAK